MGEKVVSLGQKDFVKEKDSFSVDVMKERKLNEIYIGVTGPIGSGTSLTAKKLKEIFLEREFEAHIIKVSALIEQVSTSKFTLAKDIKVPADRIKYLQKKGNLLREHVSPYAIAKLVCAEIVKIRKEQYGDEYLKNPHNKKTVFIFDSIKNPNEIIFFKEIYKSAFFLFGILTTENVCLQRIKNKGYSELEFHEIFEVDSGNKQEKHEQQVRDCVKSADIFIRNDITNLDELKSKLNRYIDLLLRSNVVTPSAHETAMHHAFVASASSACMSRQVGVAIVSENGSLLSTGHNDVPKAFGGLYDSDSKPDQRCFGKGGICYNDKHKDEIYNELFKLFGGDSTFSEFKAKVKTTRVKELIEFSRAVHAEMDAITQISRTGRGTTSKATLYTTTFPCHNCARHIVASGIKDVYYIEPYPKSLALSLHDDAITQDPQNLTLVRFLAYEGVAPMKYSIFFSRGSLKNKDGGLHIESKGEFFINERLSFDKLYELELKMVTQLEEKLKPS